MIWELKTAEKKKFDLKPKCLKSSWPSLPSGFQLGLRLTQPGYILVKVEMLEKMLKNTTIHSVINCMGHVHAECGLHVITGSRAYRSPQCLYVCHVYQGQDLPLQYWSGWWRWEADSSWLAPSTCCACPPAASTWRRTPGTSRSTPSSCRHRAGPLCFVTAGRRGRRGTAPAARGRCPPSLLPSYGGGRGGMSDGWLTLIRWVYTFSTMVITNFALRVTHWLERLKHLFYPSVYKQLCRTGVSLFYPPIWHQWG